MTCQTCHNFFLPEALLSGFCHSCAIASLRYAEASLKDLQERHDALKLDHRKLLDAYTHYRLLAGFSPDPSGSSPEPHPDFKSQLQ